MPSVSSLPSPRSALATTELASAAQSRDPSPTASRRPKPSPSPSARPRSSPALQGPTWREIGRINGIGTEELGLASVEGGYLATEATDTGVTQWFSNDGRRWKSDTVAGRRPSCPGELGICGMWAIADGWESLAAEPGEGVAPSLWRSSDGVKWDRVSLPDDVASILEGQAWVAPDGTTLLLLDPTGSGNPSLETLGVLAADGSWRSVRLPDSCPDPAYDLVLAPAAGGPDIWAISDGTATCTSADLRHWQKGKLPVKDGFSISDWVGTRLGIIAIGENSDGCDRPFQLLSSDGLHWTRVRPALTWPSIVDGPAGVIGVSGPPCDGTSSARVWRLQP